jgi:hypothetical protein
MQSVRAAYYRVLLINYLNLPFVISGFRSLKTVIREYILDYNYSFWLTTCKGEEGERERRLIEFHQFMKLAD